MNERVIEIETGKGTTRQVTVVTKGRKPRGLVQAKSLTERVPCGLDNGNTQTARALADSFFKKP